jgi:hypothetical protein
MQSEHSPQSNAYNIFVYAIRSKITRDYYLRRLKIFFNFIELLPNRPIEERCNLFAARATKNPSWAFESIIKFLQFQKDRVEKEEITGATLRNFIKPLKLFCEMSDIPIVWKKITRGLPKFRRHADDRAPTLEEVQKICEYPDRRIKAIVYTMASSGIRLGAWDYLRWDHIIPIKRDGTVLAAKIIVYAGDDEEYFSFLTPEAYHLLKNWMDYRAESGEKIDEKSWVMRQLWNTKEGHYHHGKIKDPSKLQSSGVKRLMEDALWTQGIRKKSNLIKNRYEFQTDHGLRKWYKTRCELAGMKSINIEILMGHSIGISDSYYKITEKELLNDYVKAIDLLTIGNEYRLNKQISNLKEQSYADFSLMTSQFIEKENENTILRKQEIFDSDAIAALSEQVNKLTQEIESMKNQQKKEKVIG